MPEDTARKFSKHYQPNDRNVKLKNLSDLLKHLKHAHNT